MLLQKCLSQKPLLQYWVFWMFMDLVSVSVILDSAFWSLEHLGHSRSASQALPIRKSLVVALAEPIARLSSRRGSSQKRGSREAERVRCGRAGDHFKPCQTRIRKLHFRIFASPAIAMTGKDMSSQHLILAILWIQFRQSWVLLVLTDMIGVLFVLPFKWAQNFRESFVHVFQIFQMSERQERGRRPWMHPDTSKKSSVLFDMKVP